MQKRPPSQQQQILDVVTEIRAVVVGIPNTDDRGIAGAIKELKADHKELTVTVGQHSEAIARLSAFHEGDEGMSRKKKLGIWGTILVLVPGAIVGIIKAIARGNNGG